MKQSTDIQTRWSDLAARKPSISATAPDPMTPAWCPSWCVEQHRKDAEPNHQPHRYTDVNNRRCDSAPALVPLAHGAQHIYRDEEEGVIYRSSLQVSLHQMHSAREPRIELAIAHYRRDADDSSDITRATLGWMSAGEILELIHVLQTAAELTKSDQCQFVEVPA